MGLCSCREVLHRSTSSKGPHPSTLNTLRKARARPIIRNTLSRVTRPSKGTPVVPNK